MTASPKSFLLTDDLHQYVLDHSSGLDDVDRWLIAETARLGGVSVMQIAPEQGILLRILAGVTGARRAVEIGTFTGYSSLQIARGLPRDGRLLCCDVSEAWTSVATEAWRRAGVADRVELRIGPALDTLADLPAADRFDLAFIDADKQNYGAYLEALLPHMDPGSLILVDNVLWSGAVLDPAVVDADTEAIRSFNIAAAADPRLEVVLLPVADGLSLLRVR